MNVKYELNLDVPYCFRRTEKHIERRLSEGWMPERFGTFLTKYRRCEPKDCKVETVFDPDGSIFQPEPGEYGQGLEDYIENAGWHKLLDNNKKIFYTENPDALPLETDNMLKLEGIRESMIGVNFAIWVLLCLFLSPVIL